MYKVLCDNALMCDSRIEELALIDPEIQLEENKAGSFSFIIPPDHPYYDMIQRRKTIVEVYMDDDEEPIFSGMCIEATDDFYKRKKVFCEGELSFLNDSIQRPARYHGYTVRGLLEAYIQNHNVQVEESKHFQVGIVTVHDPNDYISCYTNMENTMTCLKNDLVDDLGGIIRIRHEGGVRYIDYLAESPNTNSQVIKLGKNLMDFTRNIDSSEIATAIIPLGAKLAESTVQGLETRLDIKSVNGGFDYVYSPEAVETYGWIYKKVEFDDVTTASTLKTKGEQWLAETQFENMVIEAKAIDMNLTDKSIEKIKISDQIRVVSTPHGLNKYFRLTKRTLKLNNPESDTVTLGKDEVVTLSAKTAAANEEIRKAISNIVPATTILQDAVANATALIANAMGGYVVKTRNELLVMDTDNIETATNVWRWNINGLAYSSTGYRGTYSLAMTMDGSIVADRITTGTMHADRIRGGTLTLGNVNNDSGRVEIFNGSRQMIGKWDCDGFKAQTDSYMKTNYIPKYFENNYFRYQYRDADINGDYIASYVVELDDKTTAHKVYVKFVSGNAYYSESGSYFFDDSVIYEYTVTNGRLVLTVSNWFYNQDYQNIILNQYPPETYPSIGFKDVEKIWSPTAGIVKIQTWTGGNGTGQASALKYSYDNNAVEMCASGMNIDTKNGIIESDHYSITENGLNIRLDVGEVNEDTKENSRVNMLNLSKKGLSLSAFQFDSSNNMSEFKYMELLTSLYEAGIRFNNPYLSNAPECYFGLAGIKNTEVNNSTTSSGANVRIDTDGKFHKYASSSKRYKKDITNEIKEDLAPEKLYDLNVVQYKYNDGYLGENDQRCGKDFIGFIAEEVAEVYPLACNVDGENRPEMWEIGILFPALLKLVQEQKKDIDNLTERVESLEERLGDTNG